MRAVFEPIDPLIAAAQGLSPVFVAHYDANYAILQKIEALAGRSQTQARDIYDLHLLLTRQKKFKASVPQKTLEKAVINAIGVSFDQFRGQVVEFLSSEAYDYFLTEKSWEQLQKVVIDALESCAS